ncbi:3-hydroxyacyl-CoA dehydrogenase NAD-binding domain-containing protein [Georgenia sp. SYP-B2076]|uniref:3-hydroxyacyl-CoA dehydrogenase NAD-binding domain-containing protein n=1 Tax=Georgenia sp. SYP-B2076 TaxID=2495881 RepID=UPI000F8D49F8|nr:3-hydroxyacyl-CoA dehydrogenase NAD-binding domain-containing protein [Georgenia sp. SYP-B2076]
MTSTLTTELTWTKDDDGIVTLVLDATDSSANTMTDAFLNDFESAVRRLEAERDEITGVIITSAKKSFFAGGDLHDLLTKGPEHAEEQTHRTNHIKAQLRALETLGRPVVAAINGAALGGGLEIALACHHRVAVNERHVRIGLPEVNLGLLPGGGGVVRTVRLLGLQRALDDVLLSGASHTPAKALELGLVDELVESSADLLAAARAWILANPEVVQPWDRKGYVVPGSAKGSIAQLAAVATARLAKQLKGAPYPAPWAILSTAVEGAQRGLDEALANETRYFVKLLTGQVAKNMVQGQFLDTQAVRSGAGRPEGFERFSFDRIAVIGAGMMGAGLAYVAAKNGIEVILKDVSLEAGERGKDYSRTLVKKNIGRGLMTEHDAEALLDRIVVTDDMARIAGSQAVIEAVFEDTDLKKATFAEIARHAPDALLASNTSTLPITGLATGAHDPAGFIGMHFFSPVDKMPLVEIIVGEQTGDEAIARAFDLGVALSRTCIIVNDGRGFFTSRVITKYIDEAIAMVGEGVPVLSIDHAATQSGYPAGPLQLIDETSITLPKQVRHEARTAAEAEGIPWVEHPAEAVMNTIVDELGRHGRRAGAGFYEYEDGRRIGPWKGQAERYGVDVDAVPFEDIKDRLLFSEAIETIHAFDEGILRSVADANVGSVLGIGFPRWTGGVVQFINGYPGGVGGFVRRARELAARYGDRFTPPQSVVDAVESSRPFASDLSPRRREAVHGGATLR